MKRISRCLSAVHRALPLAGRPALLMALLLTASACQKAAEAPAPAQLLPPDKMAGLLIELHTLEARTEAAMLSLDSSRALFQQEKRKLYLRNQVTDSAFTQSFRYYAVRNKELSTIYQSVIDSLAAREKAAE